MKDILLLSINDIPVFTSISGNIDVDKLTPHIRMAQRNKIRPILGIQLYEKILELYSTNALTGIYLKIYEYFVVDMLVNFAASDIVLFNSISIDNGGNYFHQPSNAVSANLEESEKLAKRYLNLAASIELDFQKFVKENKIKEIKGSGCLNNKSNFQFPWMF